MLRMIGLCKKHVEVVRLLLEAGADVHADSVVHC
jgi:hypothetical protein